MRAVNLIPRDARRGGVTPSLGKLGASHVVIALMVVALAYVTVFVLTSNTISSRKTQVANLHQQVSRVQVEVARLQSYEQFEKLAQTRADTVRQIASDRFDWFGALSDLSKVVPANTSFQSLVATASSGVSASAGSAGSSGGNVRADINAPAFELKGCTGSQDEVAQLMSRLRVINGVSRVTLEDSTKPGTGQSTSTSTSSSSGQTGCPANGPSFDMVVFFQPLAGSTSVAATSGSVK
jgi:Tfp pilus assembly protein PilN